MSRKRKRSRRSDRSGVRARPAQEPQGIGHFGLMVRLAKGAIGTGSVLLMILGFYEVLHLRPQISAPSPDPQNLLLPPFTVTNQHYLLTMHHVDPSCFFDRLLFGEGNEFRGVTAKREGFDREDLEAGSTAHFYCKVSIVNEPVYEMTVTVKLSYQLYMIPWLRALSWKREEAATFELRRDSKGSPYWAPGKSLN